METHPDSSSVTCSDQTADVMQTQPCEGASADDSCKVLSLDDMRTEYLKQQKEVLEAVELHADLWMRKDLQDVRQVLSEFPGMFSDCDGILLGCSQLIDKMCKSYVGRKTGCFSPYFMIGKMLQKMGKKDEYYLPLGLMRKSDFQKQTCCWTEMGLDDWKPDLSSLN